MSRRTKWSIGVIALLLIVGVVALSAARGGNKGVEVRMEPVQKRDLVASVTASGKVEPRTKVDLSALSWRERVDTPDRRLRLEEPSAGAP